MQRSESFLKAIFRLYAEAIWYPGRQLNYLNLQAAVNSQQFSPVKPSQESKERTRVVEPPKFITVRHVTAVFEKMGYEPSGGMKCFTILCKALEKSKSDRVSGVSDERDTFSPTEHRSSSSSTVGPNSSLAAALGLDDQPQDSPKQFDSSKRSRSQENPGDEAIKGKMSVKDFMKVAELDDVLIQVVLRRARHGLAKIIRKVEKLKDEQVATQPTAKISLFNMGNKSNNNKSNKQSVVLREFEIELDEALKAVPKQVKPTFPIANAVRRATGGAILGLVNNIATNLTGFDQGGEVGDGEEYMMKNSSSKHDDFSYES
jgi:hypothetical protein